MKLRARSNPRDHHQSEHDRNEQDHMEQHPPDELGQNAKALNGVIFDADDRSRKREAVPVVIGGQDYYRRCMDHALGQEMGHLAVRLKLAKGRKADELACKIAALLLVDAEGNPPVVDLLRAHPEISTEMASAALAALDRARTAPSTAVRQQH